MICYVFFFCPQRPINFIIIPQISGHRSRDPCAAMLARMDRGWPFPKNWAMRSGRDCRSIQADPRGGWL